MDFENVNSILIIGISGGLAKITAGLIATKFPHIKITGVDSRSVQQDIKSNNLEIKTIRYTRGNFEKLFRDKSYDIVFHLARMSHAGANTNSHLAKRLDLNIMGTSRILDLSLKFNVKKVIILSTHHVYGALSDNPVYIKEDASLRASIKYPELRDVTEMDQIATNWMWKNKKEIETIVLRPCNIIGPQINNSITQFLTSPLSPVPIDYNPMFQFIHEFDMANILIKTMQKVSTGIYNVAPDDTISIREARKIIGQTSIPVPIIALVPLAKIFKKTWKFPDYLLDYLKFSCIIENKELVKHFNKNIFRFTTREALELLKLD